MKELKTITNVISITCDICNKKLYSAYIRNKSYSELKLTYFKDNIEDRSYYRTDENLELCIDCSKDLLDKIEELKREVNVNN